MEGKVVVNSILRRFYLVFLAEFQQELMNYAQASKGPLDQNSLKPATWVVNKMMRQINGIRKTPAYSMKVLQSILDVDTASQ